MARRELRYNASQGRLQGIAGGKKFDLHCSSNQEIGQYAGTMMYGSIAPGRYRLMRAQYSEDGRYLPLVPMSDSGLQGLVIYDWQRASYGIKVTNGFRSFLDALEKERQVELLVY